MGFSFTDVPIIVHNGEAELLAFNLYPQDASWTKVTDLAQLAWITHEDPAGLHHIGFHPSYPIGNKMAYVFGYVQNSSNEDRLYQAFVHEKFHTFQWENFENIFVLGLTYQDHLNVAIQQLLYFENKALAALLADLTSIEYMKDVVAVYETRRPLMQQASCNWEDWQLRMEGIAEYVDVETFLKFPILEVSALELLDFFTQRNFGWLEEAPINLVDSAIKWRHYSAGAISSLALDVLKVSDWKEKVEQGATPMELLSKHFNMDAAEVEARYMRIKNKWDDPLYAQKIADEIQSYNNAINNIADEYQLNSGLEIQWKMPSMCPSGSNMEKSYYLANGGMLNINMSTRQVCEETDSNFYLEMNRHPIVYENVDDKGQFYKITGAILIDGQDYNEQRSSGMFVRLDINSPTVMLSYSGQGCYQLYRSPMKMRSFRHCERSAAT